MQLVKIVGLAVNSLMLALVLEAVALKKILNLVYLANHFGLPEVADFWESVIHLNIWNQYRLTV